ncbi:hypothetical protein [Rubripirellula lacrimiformis]|nr:hypothetical protein [Rubripirellula lacrimiformis]
MTLIELMVAAALSALLLVALIGVLRGLSMQMRLANRMDQPVWPSRFVQFLRRDLLAADAVWERSGIVWIRTDAPAYSSAGNTPSDITGIRDIGYRCGMLQNGRRVLERIDSDRVDVLAFEPSRIVVERLDSQGNPQPLPPSPGPVPAQVRVWVWENSAGPPKVLKDLVIR